MGYRLGEDGRGSVVSWDVGSRKRMTDQPLIVGEGKMTKVSFSPDGKTVAVGYENASGRGEVVLWDLATQSRLSKEALVLNEGTIWRLEFSPDGKTLAAEYAKNSSTIHGALLWDVVTCQRLFDKPFEVEVGSVSRLAFSPDSKTVALGLKRPLKSSKTGANETSIQLWNIDFSSWQHIASQVANRNFTRDEWRQYFPERPYLAIFPDLPVPPEVKAKTLSDVMPSPTKIDPRVVGNLNATQSLARTDIVRRLPENLPTPASNPSISAEAITSSRRLPEKLPTPTSKPSVAAEVIPTPPSDRESPRSGFKAIRRC